MDEVDLYKVWVGLDNSLPSKGRVGGPIQGNWSCWINGQHIFGAKGMDCFPLVCEVVDIVKPATILEIGFNAGHSACMWLTRSPNVKLTSIDISTCESTNAGAKYVSETFGDRFNFICHDSRTVYEKIKDQQFDLVIVDGGHSEEDCYSDLQLAKKLGAKYIVVDDVMRVEAVKNAVNRFIMEGEIIGVKMWAVAWGVGLYKMK